MPRLDECEVPIRAGDAPPLLPFRKPLDLNAWQLPVAIATVVLAISLEQILPLSDQPFQEDTLLSPLLVARVLVLFLGGLIVFVRVNGRLLPMVPLVLLGHFLHGLSDVFVDTDDERGSRYFDNVARAKAGRHMLDDVLVIEPPAWWLMRHTPIAASYWTRHVPYRSLLAVQPQGSLELMTDQERGARWHSLAAGLKALRYPTQIVAQACREDVDWFVKRALPPPSSPLASMREPIERWARVRGQTLMQRRIVVVCSAPDLDALREHERDVANMLSEASLGVRNMERAERLRAFDQVYGRRHFYPRPLHWFGIDGTDWVTIVVREFPRHVIVGWATFIVGQLPVDLALYIEPDDGAWVTRIMEWFEGRCDGGLLMPTPDTAHVDAMHDLQRIEAKLKRNEDAVQRASLVLSMPREVVPRVRNRLRKAGAVFHEATAEHEPGRWATLPLGGLPKIGMSRPLDGASVAACYPFGSSGLRSDGTLLGVARASDEAVTLDILDEALQRSMLVLLGVPGSGKTFLMQLLIERSGLPFVLIDMKPHLDAIRHGDFYRFTMQAGGDYHVCEVGKPLPVPHPFAQTYNLAMLPRAARAKVLQAIAEQEWRRAVETLDDRAFAIDECDLLGQTEEGREFVERVASQGRSVGLVGIFATQEVTDFLKNDRMAKAVSMSSVQFVLAQNPANVDSVAEKLSLGDGARDELRKFQPQPGDVEATKTRSAIMRVGDRVCSLRIEACPEEVALFTTKPADKRALRLAAERSNGHGSDDRVGHGRGTGATGVLVAAAGDARNGHLAGARPG